ARQTVLGGRPGPGGVVALLEDGPGLQMDMLALGYEILPRPLALHAGLDGEATLVLVIAAEPDGAGDFCDDGGLLGAPCFEQLRHPRQAAGDAAGPGAFAPRAGRHHARSEVSARV